ncbi:histidine kinase [Clostridium carboxidivorans P7]|uniref:histidine kinase n=1 Tax=Clostridium carboxidivorans P7 TaxID=536227 RepID=C6PZ49_9CLOT|nr:HAMP domain-containing sensor histidine kinase [Clostridium carboxidivorans]EET85491.1 histidine kinase [Clostridium carboxidivorans P7]
MMKKIKQYLNTIYNKSKRTVSLIENLHEFTKLDNSGFLINKENWDFCEFIRQIVSEYYNEFEEKGFEIEINLPENEIMYEFDKVEMERAISNIISNVLKYNKIGTKAKIELTCDNYEIQLIIADDGIGIDEGLKENIFEPFVRGDKSRYTKGGTGLGLSIANRIVQKHGGSLTIESCKEYKTVFKLKFH